MTTIKTVLPLDMDALRQVITTPDVVVEVDYANSKIKGRSALIYMTNTNLQNVMLDMEGVFEEEVFSLINDYITHKSTIMLPQLVWTVLNILFARKEVVLPVPEQAWMDQNSLIKRADVAAYLQDFQRADNVEHLVALLDNLALYAITRSVEYQKLYGDPKTLFPAVNNVDFTGFTFVNLFEHPLFLEYYTAPIATPQTYFVQQFDEYMYSGKSLFSFFSKAPIMAMMECFTSGKVTVQQLADACKDAKALGE